MGGKPTTRGEALSGAGLFGPASLWCVEVLPSSRLLNNLGRFILLLWFVIFTCFLSFCLRIRQLTGGPKRFRESPQTAPSLGLFCCWALPSSAVDPSLVEVVRINKKHCQNRGGRPAFALQWIFQTVFFLCQFSGLPKKQFPTSCR